MNKHCIHLTFLSAASILTVEQELQHSSRSTATEVVKLGATTQWTEQHCYFDN